MGVTNCQLSLRIARPEAWEEHAGPTLFKKGRTGWHSFARGLKGPGFCGARACGNATCCCSLFGLLAQRHSAMRPLFALRSCAALGKCQRIRNKPKYRHIQLQVRIRMNLEGWSLSPPQLEQNPIIVLAGQSLKVCDTAVSVDDVRVWSP